MALQGDVALAGGIGGGSERRHGGAPSAAPSVAGSPFWMAPEVLAHVHEQNTLCSYNTHYAAISCYNIPHLSCRLSLIAHRCAYTLHTLHLQVIEMAGVSAACDVWSLGATIIELVSGHPPYWELPALSAMFHIVQDGEVPLPESLSLSPACRDFLGECFRKEPSFRKSAAELAAHPWITSNVAGRCCRRR